MGASFKLTDEELADAPKVVRPNGAGVLVRGIDPSWFRDVLEARKRQANPIPDNLLAEYRKPVGAAGALIARVAELHGVNVKQILGSRGWGAVILARQQAAYELRKMGKSFAEVGRLLGGRDHSTIFHAVRVWPEKAAKLGIPVDLEAA